MAQSKALRERVEKDRRLGVFLLLALGFHALEKAQSGILPEMFWACHIATAVATVGLLTGRPALTTLGGVFHLACGLPGWILETYLHGTTLSSVVLHVVTPLVGVRSAVLHGISAWTPVAAIGLWLIAQAIGRSLDPALNVNLAWKAYETWPADMPFYLSVVGNLLLVGAQAGTVYIILKYALTRRMGEVTRA